MKNNFMKPGALRLFILFIIIFSVQQNYSQTGWHPMGPNDYGQQEPFNYTAGAVCIAPNGTPYIAYNDANNSHKLTVKKLIGSNWELVGTPGVPVANFMLQSFTIAPNGTLYIAGVDFESGGSSTDMFASVLKYNGSSWVITGTTNFLTDNIKIVIAPNGTPYIAYRDFLI